MLLMLHVLVKLIFVFLLLRFAIRSVCWFFRCRKSLNR